MKKNVVDVEGKDFMIYVKEISTWEPDVKDDDSFIEGDDISNGCMEDGNNKKDGVNKDIEDYEYDYRNGNGGPHKKFWIMSLLMMR